MPRRLHLSSSEVVLRVLKKKNTNSVHEILNTVVQIGPFDQSSHCLARQGKV